ncbi:MAG TPA: class I SAM-dependent methyltransferase, partial [Candidatus Nanopelagicales bacterium]|nr:class I SAM-dependent methyltransferase [Candidatus Nanopelagicales bacterium]
MSVRPARGKTPRQDRELEAGTTAHYEDPAYYAQSYAARSEDISYYVEQAVARGGPVLEYGCGNGRISIPIAHAGVRVTGVDRSAPMLGDLKARLRTEAPAVAGRITVHRGDMRRA